MKKNGFTLIELMLVVAIIGLLAAIALPKFANLVIKAREATAKGQMGAIRSALSIYYADNEGLYPDLIPPSCLSQDDNPSVFDGKYIDKVPALRHPTKRDDGHNGNCVPTWTGSLDGYHPWVYLVDGMTHPVGAIFLNCDHTDTRGMTWSFY